MADRAPARIVVPGGGDDRLFFAQVREDPLLEIEVLRPQAGGTVVVVGSGGCTALSMLAGAGNVVSDKVVAGNVVAVDVNRTQHHLIELKALAVARLGPEQACGFLGGSPMPDPRRARLYAEMSGALSPGARAWADASARAVTAGILSAGVTERFIASVMAVVRHGIHPPSRIRRLLACRTLEEQRRLYRQEWDTRRWHLLFTLLLNRAVFRHTYSPAFFEHLEKASFARHFDRVAEHTLTEVPVATNYFVHHMLTGSYPLGVDGGLPPYLDPAASGSVSSWADRLTLVEGGYTEYLRTRADHSVDGFALSNICEWFTPPQIEELFAEIVRTAVPGATLAFRNFLGWTEVPPRWRQVVVEDRACGEELIGRDRSAVQRRFAVCRIDGS